MQLIGISDRRRGSVVQYAGQARYHQFGRGVVVGALSTVLYDTHIGDYVRLSPLTVVMKGEALPANTEWAGAPAVPAAAAATEPDKVSVQAAA